MKRNVTLGALLIGVGVGLLINTWFPGLRFLWPLGLIAGGVLLWREVGPYAARVALIAASLAIPLFGGFGWRGVSWAVNVGGGRELATLESTDEDEEAWAGLERLLIVNTVGDIMVKGDDELEVEVVYRGNRRTKNAVPETLQTDYDVSSRTLRIIGVDPKLSENERRNLSAEMTLSVPENVQVEVVSNIGDINVSNLAAANLETNVGDVRLENVIGDIEVTTNTGDITLDLDENVNAPIRAKSNVGDVTLELESDSNVSITATSNSRDLSGDLDKVTGNEGRSRLGSGDYEVNLSTNVGGIRFEER
jgi:hypothetical protein